jgi:hypothetical protein
MKYFLFLLISFILFSCKTPKENISTINIVESKNIELDTIKKSDTLNIVLSDSDGDGFLDSIDKCPYVFGFDNGCPEVSFITIENEQNKNDKSDFEKLLDNQKSINEIEKHEKKTKLKVIDKSTSDTTNGWIAYSIPTEMKVAKSYSVKIRISKKINGQNKSNLILGSDDAINNKNLPSIATIEDVKISGEMSAELRGDVDAFDIKALSTDVQNIDDVSYTEWEWIVIPKKSGPNPLKLIVKVKDMNKDIVVFNKDISVQKNVGDSVGKFFDKYWQWFMTTIIIPIFIYFWNRKKKRKQKKS